MTQRHYYELSDMEAFAYRDLVRARHVPKLALLGKLMKETDGPINEMDGSLESMISLWEWAKSFADGGFGGLQEGVSTVLTELLWVGSMNWEREYFLGELIEHYVFEVVKNTHPNASWEVYLQKPSKVPNADHHGIGIRVSGGRVQPLSRRFGGAVRKYLDGNQAVASPSRLKDVVSYFIEVPDGAPGVDSSILVPLLGVSTEGDWDRLIVDDICLTLPVMSRRFYYELSEAEAFAYRDLVRARHVPKLALLAKLMRETDGPIEQMDASTSSLVLLWEWARRFADDEFPGVLPTIRTAQSELLAFDSLDRERAFFLGELIEHYVFEVVKRAHPDASWEVYVQRPSKIPVEQNHEIGIGLTGGRVQTMVGREFGFAIDAHVGGDSRVAKATWLKDFVELYFETPSVTPGTGSSILVPLLGVSTEGDWDRLVVDESKAVPADPADPTDSAGEGGFVGFGLVRPEESELVFAVIGTDPEELETAKPLKTVAVAEVLARHGFVDEEDRPVRASSFAEDISEFESEQVPVLVSALVTGGKLRALFLEIAVEDPAVKAFISDLDRLGEKLGARLGPTDLMENPQ